MPELLSHFTFDYRKFRKLYQRDDDMIFKRYGQKTEAELSIPDFFNRIGIIQNPLSRVCSKDSNCSAQIYSRAF